MIVKEAQKKPIHWAPYLWSIPFIALGLFFYLNNDPLLLGTEAATQDRITVFKGDLESFDDQYFLDEEYKHEGAAFVTTKYARSGKHSIALNATDQVFGLTTVFNPTDYKATYHLSVWRYNPDNVDSWLVAAAVNVKDLYLTLKNPLIVKDGDWELLDIVFQVPPGAKEIKLYCYAGGDGSNVYFDDFTLEKSNLSNISLAYDIPQINLSISKASLNALQQKRDNAWEKGLISAAEKDWVPAKIEVEGKELDGKIRLKGDWLDHLRGTKWSFRVKLKEDVALWGMSTFNIQKPDTRGFLNEWLYHDLLEEVGVLTPNYRFVVVSLNGDVLGFYACEEHFMKELIESREKREGPILKFTENRFWDGIARQFAELGKGGFVLSNDKEDAFKATTIVPFKENSFEDNPVLWQQYNRGAQLMAIYKDGGPNLNQVFDVDLVGRFLAMIELTGAYHNLTWHNQRWYYNPISDRLEPIGYDGFTAGVPVLHDGSSLLADEAFQNEIDQYEPYRALFYDPEIVKSYILHLDSFSRKEVVEEILSSRDTLITVYEKAFQEEYFNYQFNREAFLKRAALIRMSIPAYDQTSVHAIRNEHDPNKLTIINRHHLPIEIVTSTFDQDGSSNMIYPTSKRDQAVVVPFNTERSQLKFRVVGLPQVYSTEISAFGYSSLPDKAMDSLSLQHPLCSVTAQDVVILSGQTSESIFIPKGYRVLIPEGTHLDLIEGAYILSESPIIATGIENNLVEVKSSDGTGAIVVRNTDIPSLLSYSSFQNLGHVDDGGFVLPGGVTFYETVVEIDHCVFQNCQEEDALNIVRSTFTLNEVLFDTTASDAFDADFSTGTIVNCIFRHTGNDAVDFSGSTVEIHYCRMIDIGDKAVSAGEDSDVHIIQALVDNAVIGVASKDLSSVIIDRIHLKNVQTGFTAFQKKATYGPADIIVKNYSADNVTMLHLIDENSSLILAPASL